jgi:hypothetical protein
MKRITTLEDDRTVPYETVISCPTGSGWFLLIIAIGAILILTFDFIPAIYKGKQIDHHFVGQVIGLLFAIAGSLWVYYRTKNSKTEIIKINNKGISTPETGFVEWNLIQNEHVERDRYSDCLQFDVSTSIIEEGDKTILIDLGGYEIEADRLEYLLQLYRGRYE